MKLKSLEFKYSVNPVSLHEGTNVHACVRTYSQAFNAYSIRLNMDVWHTSIHQISFINIMTQHKTYIFLHIKRGYRVDALLGLTYTNTCTRAFLLTGNSHTTLIWPLPPTFFLSLSLSLLPSSLLPVVFLSQSSSRAYLSCYPPLLSALCTSHSYFSYFFIAHSFLTLLSLGSCYSVAETQSFFQLILFSLNNREYIWV